MLATKWNVTYLFNECFKISDMIKFRRESASTVWKYGHKDGPFTTPVTTAINPHSFVCWLFALRIVFANCLNWIRPGILHPRSGCIPVEKAVLHRSLPGSPREWQLLKCSVWGELGGVRGKQIEKSYECKTHIYEIVVWNDTTQLLSFFFQLSVNPLTNSAFESMAGIGRIKF